MNKINFVRQINRFSYLIMLIAFGSVVVNAQDLSVSERMYASFQNRWTNDFLEYAGGSAMLSPINYNSFELIPVPNIPETYYIKLKENELYLNIENGLKITEIKPGWLSAMWKFKKVKDSEYYQIVSYWKGIQLNNENKTLEISAAGDGWLSAMWKVSLKDVSQTLAEEYENYKISDPYLIVEESADGGTDPAIFGNINLRLLKNGKVEKTWSLFSRTADAGSRVICPEKKTIALDNPATNEVISILAKERGLYEISVEAHLWDYDATSSNDLLGFDGSKMSLGDVFGTNAEASLYLLGEGKVKIAARITKMGSNGFIELYEESKAGGAYNTNDDPDPWIYTATKNWLGLLPDDVMLKNISIPGTHDSGAKFGGPNAAAQSWTITEQLSSGIRFLDIRIRSTGDAFAIHHGPIFQEIMFGDILAETQNFLKNNPKEVILMRIKKEQSDASGSRTADEIWIKYFENFPGLFYTGSQNIDVKLGEVRGKIFVLCETYCHMHNGINYTQFDKQDYYNVTTVAHNYLGESTATLPEKKVQINKHIDKAETSNDWVLNFLSGGTSSFIKTVASQTNVSTFEYLGRKNKKRKLGILAMDYPGEQLIYRIIKSNFQLRY